MASKDDLIKQMVRTLLEFMRTSELSWDETYFRFVEFCRGSTSLELLYRNGRKLRYPMVDEEILTKYEDTLASLAALLFNAISDEGRQRPVVAVICVDSHNNYKLKFDYANAKAMGISLLELGTENSYFGGEVDIPEVVTKTQDDLKAKGLTTIPSFTNKD